MNSLRLAGAGTPSRRWMLEAFGDLRHLREALAGPMAVDPQDRRELQREIRELEADLASARARTCDAANSRIPRMKVRR